MNDEPSAYPQTEEVGDRGDYRLMQRGGLTKREVFAALAMHQLLNGAVLPTAADRAEWLPMLAGVACEVADAMVSELAKAKP